MISRGMTAEVHKCTDILNGACTCLIWELHAIKWIKVQGRRGSNIGAMDNGQAMPMLKIALMTCGQFKLIMANRL